MASAQAGTDEHLTEAMRLAGPALQAHLLNQSGQHNRHYCRRAVADVLQASAQGRADFLGFTHRFAVAIGGLRHQGEVRRWIEKSSIVVARAGCRTVGVCSFQTPGAGAVGPVYEDH